MPRASRAAVVSSIFAICKSALEGASDCTNVEVAAGGAGGSASRNGGAGGGGPSGGGGTAGGGGGNGGGKPAGIAFFVGDPFAAALRSFPRAKLGRIEMSLPPALRARSRAGFTGSVADSGVGERRIRSGEVVSRLSPTSSSRSSTSMPTPRLLRLLICRAGSSICTSVALASLPAPASASEVEATPVEDESAARAAKADVLPALLHSLGAATCAASAAAAALLASFMAHASSMGLLAAAASSQQSEPGRFVAPVVEARRESCWRRVHRRPVDGCVSEPYSSSW